ncbi:hypothetical protein DCAR_0415644 [Daucus carota subsp. sativus]|uniref:Glycosyltransferase 61 catalytic domain-containing protein n=1 Tax=Daucus carota subsp. sativus TaxID=79200 RepID=A0AAF0WVK6_DAUCS|nr:hypothetical protein DCAR_0415644 [Daucus carota subsp. sativus]
MLYDPIFSKSFSRFEQQKIGRFAFLACAVIALSICTVFKPQYHVRIVPSISLQFPRSVGGVDTAVIKDRNISEPLQYLSVGTDAEVDNEATRDTLQLSANDGLEAKLIKLVCSLSEPVSDYCELEGDIRIHPNSSTIFVVSHRTDSSFQIGTSWVIKPYARKGNEGAMESVKSWTIKVISSHQTPPSCTADQSIPAILFSLAGYSGNHFHDFSDIIIPLFSTSRKFDGEVHFLATDYKAWWSSKYRGILGKLSKHKVNDIDREEGIVCYKSMIIGLKTRKELGIAQSSNIYQGLSMKDFRDFLRSAYSLKTKNVTKMRKGTTEKPRMMIISRKKSRTLVNENKITKMGENMGYEVIVADATLSTDLSKFAELVNSCSVLIGVHGAGLTNMVFLPDNAVVIQIVPLGIEWYARRDFEEPALDMNIRYLSYKIKVKESSLIQEYSVKSATIRNSLSVNKNDWGVIRSVYLDRQNVILDVRRFRRTLSKAFKLLHQ